MSKFWERFIYYSYGDSSIMNSIFKLYPQVVTIRGNIAYDKDENIVAYDLDLVKAEQAIEAKRQEALAYLASTDFMMTADYDK